MQELLLRWAEYSVITPVMRTHEGNQPERNHQVLFQRRHLLFLATIKISKHFGGHLVFPKMLKFVLIPEPIQAIF